MNSLLFQQNKKKKIQKQKIQLVEIYKNFRQYEAKKCMNLQEENWKISNNISSYPVYFKKNQKMRKIETRNFQSSDKIL